MPALTDTHLEAEQVQIRLLREAGVTRRLRLTFGLTQTALELSAEALRRRHPGLPESELRLLGVALRYGDDTAEAVRTYLEAGKAANKL